MNDLMNDEGESSASRSVVIILLTTRLLIYENQVKNILTAHVRFGIVQ